MTSRNPDNANMTRYIIRELLQQLYDTQGSHPSCWSREESVNKHGTIHGWCSTVHIAIVLFVRWHLIMIKVLSYTRDTSDFHLDLTISNFRCFSLRQTFWANMTPIYHDINTNRRRTTKGADVIKVKRFLTIDASPIPKPRMPCRENRHRLY